MADIQAEQKILCRASTVHAHPEDSMALEELFATEGWQTLLTIMVSSIARKLNVARVVGMH